LPLPLGSPWAADPGGGRWLASGDAKIAFWGSWFEDGQAKLEGHPRRPQLECIPLRYGNHHPARFRSQSHQGNPDPTYYGDEICRVDGLKYAFDVVKASLQARLQEVNLFYDRRFDCRPPEESRRYPSKLDFESTHSRVIELVPEKARVLDLGCGMGAVGAAGAAAEYHKMRRRCADGVLARAAAPRALKIAASGIGTPPTAEDVLDLSPRALQIYSG
jgi:hypothetical protein